MTVLVICANICVMSKEAKIPLLNKEKRAQNHYLRRWIGAIAITGLSVLGFDKLALSSYNLPKDTMAYSVKPGDTAWSIATAEGPQIADNAEAMHAAIDDIEKQIPKSQDGNLIPQEVILLPSGSENGTPINNK